MKSHETKYQIVQKGNGKFFVRFVREKEGHMVISCMVGNSYYDTKEEALFNLQQEKHKRQEAEKLNKEKVVYEEKTT
jgi:hypothetical protein